MGYIINKLNLIWNKNDDDDDNEKENRKQKKKLNERNDGKHFYLIIRAVAWITM